MRRRANQQDIRPRYPYSPPFTHHSTCQNLTNNRPTSSTPFTCQYPGTLTALICSVLDISTLCLFARLMLVGSHFVVVRSWLWTTMYIISVYRFRSGELLFVKLIISAKSQNSVMINLSIMMLPCLINYRKVVLSEIIGLPFLNRIT